MHPVKRRKIDPMHSSLSKPFRSPLRIRNSDAARRPQTSADSQSATLDQPATACRQETAVALAKTDARSQQRQSPGDSQQKWDSGTRPATLPLIDYEIDRPQKQYTALARQLTLLRQSLDTAQQALKIQSANQAADLDKQIAKWRSIVRDTAEELFEDAKHRLDHQGIGQTWLQQQDKERPDLWFDDCQDQLTEAQRRMREMQRADDLAEAEKYGLIEKTAATEVADTSFTLDKMLLRMNCDLNLVGYDKEEQRWLD
ncbi:hypothetical protein DV736_g611, partial [Chaetothyriales sp. CBS 134916]